MTDFNDAAIQQWLAQQGLGHLSKYGGAVDPSMDPIFGAPGLQHGLEQSAPTQGFGTGIDWMQWSTVPGYEQFYVAPQLAGTENEYGGGIDIDALNRWMADNGYSMHRGVGNISDDVRWLQDAQGNLVGTPTLAKNTSASDLNTFLGILGAAGAAAYGGLGAGGAGVEGAAGAAGAAGAGGGLTSAEAAALFGDVGYGAGMTGLETAAFDAGLGGLGGAGGLVDSSVLGAEFNPAGITNPNFGLGADFAQVSPLNGGGMDWSSLLSSPQLWGNVINAGAGIWGANKAAGAQRDAGRDANALAYQMFEQQRADYAPYMQAGYGALGKINALLQDPTSITSDPSYGFQFDEGLKALNSGAAARGMSQSGAADKARIRYGQDYGASKLDQTFNRYASVAGLGQTATQGSANAAGNYGQQAGNNLIGMGNARGSAYMGGANALADGINNGLSAWQNQTMYNDWLRRAYPGGG